MLLAVHINSKAFFKMSRGILLFTDVAFNEKSSISNFYQSLKIGKYLRITPFPTACSIFYFPKNGNIAFLNQSGTRTILLVDFSMHTNVTLPVFNNSPLPLRTSYSKGMRSVGLSFN